MAKHATRMLPVAAAAILLSSGLPSAAEAGWHRGHHHHHGGGYFGMTFLSPPEPIYYPQPVVYYEPPPALPNYDNSAQWGRTVNDNTGRYCREYTSTTSIGGRPASSYGTACMQPDGSWEIQN